MLPPSSQKVVDYWWPVVEAYTKIQMEKGFNKPFFLKHMDAYLDSKTFLVREKKALMAKVLDLYEDA